jgi:hypothetical protein
LSDDPVKARLKELNGYVDEWHNVIDRYLKSDNPPIIIAFVAETVLHHIDDHYLTHDIRMFLGLGCGHVEYGELRKSLGRACVNPC